MHILHTGNQIIRIKDKVSKMWKKLSVIIITLITTSVLTFAGETLKYTVDLTADGQAITGRANFYGLYIVTDGSNTVTFDLHDGTSTAGTKIIPTTVIDPFDGTNQTISFGFPVVVDNGLYVNITTTGTVTFKVYYNTIFK